MGTGALRTIRGTFAAIAIVLCVSACPAAPAEAEETALNMTPPPLAAFSDLAHASTSSTAFTIDANGPDNAAQGQFLDVRSALDALPDNAGDVTFVIESDLYQDYASHIFELPTDKGVTSFTLTSTVDDGVTVGRRLSGNSNSLYANGIPVTIGAHVAFGGHVYGGTNGTPLVHDTSVTIAEGAEVNAVYGGDQNASLVGNTSSVVGGTVVSAVVGGGHASISSSTSAAIADVDGSTSIAIEASGITKNAYGAGRAEAPSSGSSPTSVQANVSGSSTLRIAGATEQTNGGGFAGPSSYALDVENARATANLGGSARIVFEATAISSESDWMNQVYGGGWAQGTKSETNRVIADVAGSTYVEALGDDTASSSQPNIKAFNALYGGGWALYRNAQANVEGDTLVKTARPNWESREALAGGGLASWGATANVGGTSSVEVFSIAGQRSSYENANLVVGGGVALCGVEGIGTYAQSGATKVVIHTGARLTSGSSSGANIIGGGYALSSNTNTDVMGGTSFIVEDDTALPKKVIGGGVVFSASNAGGFTQEGTASACVDKAAISIGERCTISQYVIGGGYIGRNTKNATADTGDTSTTIGASTTLASNFIGGSMVESSENNQANVVNIDTTLAHNVTIADRFVGGNYLYNAKGTKADIAGDVNTSMGDESTINGNSATGGSFIWGASDSTADIEGNITTTAGDGVKTKSFAGGGMPYAGANSCSASIAGSITTEFGNDYTVTAGEFVGAGYAYYNTSSCSANAASVRTTFKNHASVKTIIGAGWARSGSSDSANVTSSAALTFGDDASVTSTLFSGGNVNSSTNSTADSGAVAVSFGKRAILSQNLIGAGNVYNSANGHANTTSTDLFLGSESVINGWAECGGNVESCENGAANVGFTKVTFDENCTVKGSFVGGGYVYGGTQSQANAGDITTAFGASCQISNWYEGGGFLSEGTRNQADAGNITARFEDGCSIGGSMVGGGYLYKTEGGSADTGSINTTMKNDCSVANWLYGNSYASQSPDGHAHASSVTTTIGDRFKLGAFFLGGSYAYGDGTEANVVSDISTSIGNEAVLSGKFAIGGSLVEGAQGGSVEIGGNVSTTIGSEATTNSFVGGSMAWGPKAGCNASVQGTVVTTFGDNYTMASQGLSFVGGGYLYFGTDGSSCETTCGAVETHFGNNADLGTGQHWVTAAGRIVGTSSTGNVGIGAATSGENVVTFTAGTDFSTYLYAGGGILAEGTAAGTCSTAITGNVESSFDGGDIKWFFGGAYLPDENGDGTIAGDITNQFTGFTFPANDGAILTGASSHASVIGDVTTTLKDSTLGASPRLGGSNGTVSGNAKIVLNNISFNNTLEASSSAGIEGTQIYTFVGTTPYDKYVRTEQAVGTFLVEIGDELGTPTSVTMSGVYDSAPDEAHRTNVLVHQNATLNLEYGGTDAPFHLSGVNDLQVERNGTLAVPFCTAQATIAGNLTGSGAILLPAGGSIAGSGTLDGDMLLEVSGTPIVGQTYFDFSGQSTGSISYADPDKKLILEKDDTTTDHAKWIMRELTYSVTFDAQGGTDTSTVTVASGNKVPQPDEPTRNGHVFEGWFLDAEGTQSWDFNTDMVEADLTLYAKWTVARYTITFDARGGSPVPSTQTVQYGEVVSEPAQPTKANFMFDGWYADAAGEGDPWNFAEDAVSSNLTLYAKWVDGIPVSVAVAADDQGAEHGSVSPTTPQVYTGTPLEYTLTPDYGYQIGSVAVNGDPLPYELQKDLRSAIVTYEPTVESSIVVTFIPLKNETASDIIDNLPTVEPDDAPDVVEEKQDTVLDAKLDYESMPDEEKKAVEQEVVDKLNEAVTSLPSVNVKVELAISPELDTNVEIPEKDQSRFIGAVSKDEIEQLKNGTAQLLKVVVSIKSIEAPESEDEKAALASALGSLEIGQHFSASVTKQLFADPTESSPLKSDPITALPAPVQLTFQVPQPLLNPGEGTARSFAVARTHFAESWQAELRPDEDGDETNESVTISTDRFSTYSIVYQDTHTVTFVDGASTLATTQVVNGSSAAAPQPDPTKQGWTFVGWYASAAFAGDPYDFDAPVTTPLVLHAKWAAEEPPAPAEHAVSFESNGGTPVGAQRVADGEAAARPADPAREGYEFAGWYADAGLAGDAYDFDAPVTGPVTLYAKWIETVEPPAVEHEVAFASNGGTPVDPQTVADGELAAAPADPAREGYEFAGWFADARLTAAWDFDRDPVTGPVTLYAKWERIEHAVSFESNGGTAVAGQVVAHGDKALEPVVPTCEGFAFDGWFADKGLTTPYDFNTPVTADLVLYAKWAEGGPPAPAEHAVSFGSNGGTPVGAQRVADGGAAARPADPTREGYEFGGWYADAALAAPYDFDAPVTADLVLYAKWTAKAAPLPTPDEDVTPQQPDTPKELPASSSTTAEKLAPTGDTATLPLAVAGIALVMAGALTLRARRTR